MRTFEEFFARATGKPPYGYQRRIAEHGLPDVVEAPTGAGKTEGTVLPWLWRRVESPAAESTPRRLVYALPQRSLVEQVAANVSRWLDALGLSDEVALHVVMGGEGKTQREWRMEMDRPAVVVGTVDSLVSKALVRGYGLGRAMYPIDFALVTNDVQWVIDEMQLAPESTTTLRQLAAFAARLGTAKPFRLTCVSATIPPRLLDTVDNPGPVTDVVRIEDQDRVGELATRLGARRTVRRLAAPPGDYKVIAKELLARHRTGTLTLAVVNTVDAAREIHRALRNQSVPATLVHSRFRSRERSTLTDRVTAAPGDAGHIVVATQVIEAGIDVDAAVLLIEAAPWPSVVQRAGRCNRRGLLTDAELLWVPPKKPDPYLAPDVHASVAALTELEGVAVTGESLVARAVETSEPEVAVLRRMDFVELFDTTPDLDGGDIDIAPYVRDAEDLDAQVAWAVWEPVTSDGRPPDDAKAPEAQWRCRVPLRELAVLVKGNTAVWRFDQVAGRWSTVTARQPARPGEVLLVAAKDGRYDPVTGFDPAVKAPVAEAPPLIPVMDPASGVEDAYRADSASVAQRDWLSLEQHSEDVRAQARALLAALQPEIPGPVGDAVVLGAYLHDIGKSHKTWQDALCALAPAERRAEIDAGRPWAKSGTDGRLEFAGGVRFRHELASLFILDGPLSSVLSTVDDPDLVRYLMLAHHGKLRVQVREPGDADQNTLLGLSHGTTFAVPEILGHSGGEVTVDLDQFAFGGGRSWTRTALALRDRYGPFVLAYLETLVRIADWRASENPGVGR